MGKRPKLLDLFCGAGGCSVGYYQAGFKDIVGVDIEPQKRYPFEFVQGDALEFLAKYGKEFDIIHASPPCQAYSVTKSLATKDHPDLVAETRELLLKVGKPYIIENVPGAPLENPLMLCGTMFKLRVIRHRLFEIWPEPIWFPPVACNHWSKIGKNGFCCLAGSGSGNSNKYPPESRRVNAWRKAVEIDWMIKTELAQAIPPAYTKYIGEILLERMTK